MATAGTLLTRLNEKLNDVGAVRWPDAEHFRAMNDALGAILEARPDLFEVYANFTPVAGVRQTVPADCFILFDVMSNLDTASNDMTTPITPVKRATLDRQRPSWPSLAASAIADHWMQDNRSRSEFQVCPPQHTTVGKFLIRYAQRPTVITASGDALPLYEESINAMYNFCMHRALEKDEKFAGSPTAEAYMMKFAQFIAARTAGEDAATAAKAEEEG